MLKKRVLLRENDSNAPAFSDTQPVFARTALRAVFAVGAVVDAPHADVRHAFRESQGDHIRSVAGEIPAVLGEDDFARIADRGRHFLVYILHVDWDDVPLQPGHVAIMLMGHDPTFLPVQVEVPLRLALVVETTRSVPPEFPGRIEPGSIFEAVM